MKLNYLRLLLLICLLSLGLTCKAQEKMEQKAVLNTKSIEGLTIFPNPISNGRVYINSRFNLKKQIEIYDVLGKKVISTSQLRRELDVSNLTAGVYILKLKEGNTTATRKLVIR